MAHVSMHQYNSRADLGNMLLQAGIKHGELSQRERESKRDAGVKLQTTKSQLDTEIEKAKINARTQRDIATKRAGFDLQLKQMGVDAELALQKMRNLNALEVKEVERKTQELLENLKDKHVQAQILQTYKTNLKLANYNAKAALLRTYNEVLGDIYKTGDPLSNAADAAAYNLFVMAFTDTLWRHGGKDLLDEEASSADESLPQIVLPGGGKDGKTEQIGDESPLPEGNKWAVRKDPRTAKPQFKTKERMRFNKGLGQTGRKSW